MRRATPGSLALIALLAGVLLLGGCGHPPGTDGNLVDAWPMAATPTPYAPAASGCFVVSHPEDLPTKLPTAIDCEVSHNIETVLVGSFTGADADRPTAPPQGGAERRKAFAQCASAAKEYLGDDWHNGALALLLTVPTDGQWSGGGRWFRCDLATIDAKEAVVRHTGSLKGGLTGDRQFALTCLETTGTDDDFTIDRYVPCTVQHTAEYAGFFEAPDTPYPNADARQKLSEQGCPAVIAKFAAIPNDRNFEYRVGWISDPPEEDAWELGDRGIRCYIWPEKPRTGSLKGAGPGALPVD